ESGRADGAERLLVIHPHGSDETDGAERPVDEPVARADERDLGQRWVGELVAQADERTLRRTRLPEHVDQVGAALDELEQASVRAQLLGPYLAEQVCRPADVQALLGRDELRECRPKRREEGALGVAEALVLEPAPEQRSPELQPGDRLV